MDVAQGTADAPLRTSRRFSKEYCSALRADRPNQRPVTRPNICGKSTCATVGRNRLRVDLSVGLCLAAPVASLLALWDVKPNWTTTDRPPDLLGAHRLGVAANVLNNHILNCGAVANRDSHDWRVDECRNSRSASVFSFLWLYRGLQSLRLPI